VGKKGEQRRWTARYPQLSVMCRSIDADDGGIHDLALGRERAARCCSVSCGYSSTGTHGPADDAAVV